MSRKQSREAAFKIIYAISFSNDDQDPATLPDENAKAELDIEYIQGLVKVTKDNLEQIDEKIRTASKDFTFDRIYKTDLAALRLGLAEGIFMPGETPVPVIIAAAVDLAKKYGEASPGFVNGILASILNN